MPWGRSYPHRSSLFFFAQGPSSYLSHNNESLRSSTKGNDYELSEEGYEPEKPLRKSSRASPNSSSSIDGTRKTATQMQWKNTPEVRTNGLDADDGLDALLKEEEDLVIAHREQVEESINILREEMKLLEEADQPGNQLDEYLTRMSFIISKKAAGLMNLQTRLARFQQCLSEQNVLVNQSGL